MLKMVNQHSFGYKLKNMLLSLRLCNVMYQKWRIRKKQKWHVSLMIMKYDIIPEFNSALMMYLQLATSHLASRNDTKQNMSFVYRHI